MTSVSKLLHVFSTMAIGGPQIRFGQLVHAMPAGYRHLVVAMDGNFDALDRLNPEAPVEKVVLDFDKKQTLRNWWLFRKTLARVKPDLLITYNWGAIEWGLVNLLPPRFPHVVVLDGFGPEEARASLARRVRLRRFVYAKADAVVVPSRTLERLAVGGWGLKADLVRYLPNGVDTEKFAGAPDTTLLRQLGVEPDERLVGTVASLRTEKNLGRLLEAFKQATGAVDQVDRIAARLLIIGDGPERAVLTRRAAELGIADRVVFAGNIDRPERLLGALSIYAVSSDTEQMPISLIEAMAAGLPVASVDVGDISDMVAQDNRSLVVGADADALARSLRALLTDPERAVALGAANRECANLRFSEAAMAAGYDRSFRAAIRRAT